VRADRYPTSTKYFAEVGTDFVRMAACSDPEAALDAAIELRLRGDPPPPPTHTHTHPPTHTHTHTHTLNIAV
jgi:hypothetical protein